MGTVILKKKDKTIKIPFFLYRLLFDKDVVFSDDVQDITFLNCNCKFNRYIFELSKHQSIRFLNCNFNKDCLKVLGGNFYIDDISTGIRSLELQCQSVYLNNTTETNMSRKISSIFITAADVEVIGNIESTRCIKIKANNLIVNNANLLSEGDIDLASIRFSIKNSSFESLESKLSFSYKFLNMKDVLFLNQEDEVDFFNIIDGNFKNNFYCKPVVSYKGPVALTDSDILDNKSIYSLLSILKGYNNKINSINDDDIRDAIAKIENDAAISIKNIEEQKQELINAMNTSKKEIENDLSKRKVKSLIKG